jgi:hypothetical protein
MATELSILADRLAIEDLNSRFCYYLDRCMNAELLELFTSDAHYRHGERRSLGHEEIAAVFNARNHGSPRTARHVQTGLLIDMKSRTTAAGSSCCVTFAANALPPVQGTEPLLVADFYDEYVKCDDGQWRIKSRDIERIFVSPGNSGPVGMNTQDVSVSSESCVAYGGAGGGDKNL